MKAIARFLMPALLLALVSTFGSTITALAQDFPPVGTILFCPFRGDITISQNGQDYVGTVEGSGTFQVIESGSASASYLPVDIQATSTFEELGTFTTRLNNGAAVRPSVANSINADGGFPVRIEMIYPPIVTGPDGVEYVGGEVNFLIDESDSFDPIVGATSHLENSVTFGQGDQTFTLVSLNATFNP